MSEPLDLEPVKARDAALGEHVIPDWPFVCAWDRRALLAEVERLRGELADMVPRDWHGLMAILDYAYPESIFPTLEDAMTRDPGPRIVSLIRHLDQARAELARRDEQITEAERRIEKADVEAMPPLDGGAA